MLRNHFFDIEQHAWSETTGVGEAALTIDPSHTIFEGHFPGQPVVPGVCMLQMVREVAEAFLARPMRIPEADSIKFLSVMDPRQHARVQLTLSLQKDGDGYAAQASLFAGSVIFFKFKGRLQPA